MEVVAESIDPGEMLREVRSEHGIDIVKIWKQVRDMDLSEFVTIDSDEMKMKVYKDRDYFRVSGQEVGHESANIEVKIPIQLIDYFLDESREAFRLSDLVNAVQGHLPLTLVEVTKDDAHVKVWLEEK